MNEGVAFLIAVITVATFCITKCTTDKAWKQIQVENGNAEWKLTPKGNVYFKIIPHSETK